MGLKEPKAVYVVKVRLKAKPPVTSMAWALYVGDERVSKPARFLFEAQWRSK